jgi:hypothetical protein
LENIFPNKYFSKYKNMAKRRGVKSMTKNEIYESELCTAAKELAGCNGIFFTASRHTESVARIERLKG